MLLPPLRNIPPEASTPRVKRLAIKRDPKGSVVADRHHAALSSPNHELLQAFPALRKPSRKLLAVSSSEKPQDLRVVDTHAGSDQFVVTRAARWRLVPTHMSTITLIVAYSGFLPLPIAPTADLKASRVVRSSVCR